MAAQRRMTWEDRRAHLIRVAAELFAEQPYDSVSMEEVAARGGVSRALLYRHFPSKQDLFAAIYREAADRLLDQTVLDTETPLMDQVIAGLDAHFDYFEANRHTVLAANRTLAGDPTVQSIIDEELDTLRRRMVNVSGAPPQTQQELSAVLHAWLGFVRTLCVDWLTDEAFGRDRLRAICVGALSGALASVAPAGQA